MRRLAAALVVACTGLVLCATPSAADEQLDERPWTGSALDPGPATLTSGAEVPLSGIIRRSTGDVDRTVRVDLTAAAIAGGCPLGPASSNEAMTPRSFAFVVPVPCNGTYRLEVRATTTSNSVFFPAETSPAMERTVAVAVPPADVSSVEALAAPTRTVSVTWPAVAPKSADHLGYVVDRRDPDGTVTSFAVGDVTSFEDTTPPKGGGEITYTVMARRPGATPDREVRSVGSPSQSVSVSAAPGGSGATGGSGASGGAGGTGGTDGATPGGAGGGSAAGGATSRRPGSSVRVPRVGTPSGSFFPPLLSPPSAEDAGFSETLPFEDQEPGQDEAELPEDEQASSPFDAAPGRGLMVPAATGLVLAVWAMHLRFLARAAKPQYVEQAELPDLVQW